MSDYKVCVGCGNSFPATTKNFHKSKDGLHSHCRKCRNKKARGARKHKRNRKLEEIEKGAVDLFIASARIGGANIPHSSELLEVMMEYFGGVRGFANAYLKQFYDAPVGGAFRTKMLDSIVRLVVGNTAMGGAKKPLELMTEEELEAELRRQVLEAAMNIKKVEVVDAVQNVPNLPMVPIDQPPIDQPRQHPICPMPPVPPEVGGSGHVCVPGGDS